jgi:hypothetical protein
MTVPHVIERDSKSAALPLEFIVPTVRAPVGPRATWTSTAFRQSELAHTHLLIASLLCVITTFRPPSSVARRFAQTRRLVRGARATRRSLSLKTDGSTTAHARVVQLATLAGGVDRIAADACILRTFGNGQPNLHRPSRACPHLRELENGYWGMRARTRRRDADAFLSACGCGQCADIEPREQYSSRGGNDLSDRRSTRSG